MCNSQFRSLWGSKLPRSSSPTKQPFPFVHLFHGGEEFMKTWVPSNEKNNHIVPFEEKIFHQWRNKETLTVFINRFHFPQFSVSLKFDRFGELCTTSHPLWPQRLPCPGTRSKCSAGSGGTEAVPSRTLRPPQGAPRETESQWRGRLEWVCFLVFVE